jgi:hypothetical protein
MIYFIYILLVPISLILTLLAVILAPILPVFARDRMGGCDNNARQCIGPRLPRWMNWFMTPDNSLDGDFAFEHLNPPSYWSRVKWLWRNPAYSFGLRYLSAPFNTTQSGDPTIRDNDNARAGWLKVHANGLFQIVWIRPIGFRRCLYVNLGWNIRALVDTNINPKPNPYEATFVFSPRISGFR